MSRRTHITLTDRQHALLLEESARSGLPMAELVRRALDGTYRPAYRRRAFGFEVNMGVFRWPDAGAVARRIHVRKPRLDDP